MCIRDSLSTIREADNILVLHRGELREEGRHEELLELGGIYHRLHRLQYGGYDDEAAETGPDGKKAQAT